MTYSYIDGCGDEQITSATITILDYVGMELDLEDIFICPGTNQNVQGTPQNGQNPFSYDWSSGGGGSAESFGQGDAGNYDLVITDFCDSTDTWNFEIIEPAPFGHEPVEEFYCLGTVTNMFEYGGAMPYTYIFPEDSLSHTSGGGFTSVIQGDYAVTIIDDCGQQFDLVLPFQGCATMIPNVFTPNGDSHNPTFWIEGIDGFPKSSLKIYNRWGTLIFEDLSYNNKWDGEDHPQGTYYYVFDRSDGQSFSGHFSLLNK
jgi:gliding motility-associated-like protein